MIPPLNFDVWNCARPEYLILSVNNLLRAFFISEYFLSTTTSSINQICSGDGTYFLSMDTWNTLWTLESAGGSAKRYVCHIAYRLLAFNEWSLLFLKSSSPLLDSNVTLSSCFTTGERETNENQFVKQSPWPTPPTLPYLWKNLFFRIGLTLGERVMLLGYKEGPPPQP